MNLVEAILELQKPENVETKCIRPQSWKDCYDHFTIEDYNIGSSPLLVYQRVEYDPYEDPGFYIPYHVDELTGEWVMCDIPKEEDFQA